MNKENYSQYQHTYNTTFCNRDEYKFAVVAFQKKYHIKDNVKSATINIFADTKYFLYVDGEYVGAGPVCPGGDYGNTRPMPVQYYNTYNIVPKSNVLEFYVLVQLSPTVQADVSCGRGGFWLDGEILYSDGSVDKIESDDLWECRLETQYKDVCNIDFNEIPDPWSKAELCENIWNIKKSPIKNLAQKRIIPVSIYKSDSGVIYAEFDKIYAGYVSLNVKRAGNFEISLTTHEVHEKENCKYAIKGKDSINYRSIHFNSIGLIKIEGVELANIVDIHIEYTHYPHLSEGSFSSNDETLNKIYEVGKHTTEICRQTIELDSPTHQENLGCTGDYYISSLISYFCFGDTSLSEFDLLRTAEYLRMTDGKMFHTSYSLIWVMMLYDNYMFSGNKDVLIKCKDALDILLRCFDGYVGEHGVLEKAPNYMFIDWIYIDKYNLHHPPMALGQTVLNAFYYKALLTAKEIYSELEAIEESQECQQKAEWLRCNFNKCFFDKEKGMYLGGMNIKYVPTDWLPKNTDTKYYLKHANILAVLYDLCDDGKALIEKVLRDKTPIQPYFMHFLIEAIYHAGLFDKYGLEEIYKWKDLVDECDKGMKEAWEIFPGYGYDYSHAWGTTPTYQLMSKISGLELKAPGFKKISLNPNLYGLEFANIKIPTPFGIIELEINKEVTAKIPDGIELI